MIKPYTTPLICPYCRGLRFVQDIKESRKLKEHIMMKCDACNGTGVPPIPYCELGIG